MKDDEEVERFRRALSRCRDCTHARLVHPLKKLERCKDGILSKEGKWSACKCKIFIPSNNLEYLEWRYKNKKEIK